MLIAQTPGKNLSAPAPDQKVLIKFYGNFDKQRFLYRKKLFIFSFKKKATIKKAH